MSNPKEAGLEFYIFWFWSFGIVSNFGFRASKILFLALFAVNFGLRIACGVTALGKFRCAYNGG
jgi:hypothetical protein